MPCIKAPKAPNVVPPAGFGEPHCGQLVCLAKHIFAWFIQLELGHCQSPRLPCIKLFKVPKVVLNVAVPAGFGEPHCGQLSFLAKTILVWFTQPALGHCQSPGLPCTKPPKAPPKVPPNDVEPPGFGEPHFGHDAFLPKTIFEWFTQPALGHCQSPSWPGLTPPPL